MSKGKKKGPKFDEDGYESHPFGKHVKLGKVVPDFLPPPHLLRLKEEEAIVEVKLALPKKSVDYFKRKARREHIPYTALIQRLVEEHAPPGDR